MLLKSQLRWVGRVSWMRNHHLLTIIQCSGSSKKRFNNCSKKSLCVCHIDHHQAENCKARRLTTILVVSFEDERLLSRTKGRGGRTTTLCNQALTRPSSAATVPVLMNHKPAYSRRRLLLYQSLSAPNLSTVGADCLLLDLLS